MDISFKRQPLLVEVTARFDPRVGHQKKVRFYWNDAQEKALKEFPDISSMQVDEGSISSVISNYREPYEATWIFHVKEDDFKKMADDFEQKKLKDSEDSGKIKRTRKRKENENIDGS